MGDGLFTMPENNILEVKLCRHMSYYVFTMIFSPNFLSAFYYSSVVSVHQPICKELTSGVLGDYIDLVYFSVIMLLSNVSTSVLRIYFKELVPIFTIHRNETQGKLSSDSRLSL